MWAELKKKNLKKNRFEIGAQRDHRQPDTIRR